MRWLVARTTLRRDFCFALGVAVHGALVRQRLGNDNSRLTRCSRTLARGRKSAFEPRLFAVLHSRLQMSALRPLMPHMVLWQRPHVVGMVKLCGVKRCGLASDESSANSASDH
jgi:hypothetical protein